MKPLLTCGSPKINVRNLTDATESLALSSFAGITLVGHAQFLFFRTTSLKYSRKEP